MTVTLSLFDPKKSIVAGSWITRGPGLRILVPIGSDEDNESWATRRSAPLDRVGRALAPFENAPLDPPTDALGSPPVPRSAHSRPGAPRDSTGPGERKHLNGDHIGTPKRRGTNTV